VQRAAAVEQIFAANRAVGRIALTVAAAGGQTRRREVYEDGPLRVRFPSSSLSELEAVLVNTAGGLAGGDRHSLDIAATAGGRLMVTTAAAEKVYRSLGSDTSVDVKLAIGPGGRVVWVPQETILFDQARLRRSIEIDMAPDASLLLAEAAIFGRFAMGESFGRGLFADRWRIRRGGALVFAEHVRLDGTPARMLAEPAVAAGGVAIATVLAIPGDDAMVEAVRGQDFIGEVGVSCWNGLAAARLCAKDGASLRRDLALVVTAMGGTLPRLWLN